MLRPLSRAARYGFPRRRTFLSKFLFGDNTAAAATAEFSQSDNAIERQVQNRLYQKAAVHLSLQHSHPSGPWVAISKAVQQHCAAAGAANNIMTSDVVSSVRVLDLACGPYGEPGSTMAHAMPNALVHCTDSCAETVASVPLYQQQANVKNSHDEKENNRGDYVGNDESSSRSSRPSRGRAPPKNLTKSIADLSNLTAFASNSMDAITCCYGYGMVDDTVSALREAYRVLKPEGVLVIATWQHCRLHEIGRDVLATVRGHGRNPYEPEDDEAFLPPRIVPVLPLELAGAGELEGLLRRAGFASVVSTVGTYPLDMGKTRFDKMAMGTLFVRDQLNESGNPSLSESRRFTEEAFCMHIGKYANVASNDTLSLEDNQFQLSIATK